jgi:hypothetical protein
MSDGRVRVGTIGHLRYRHVPDPHPHILIDEIVRPEVDRDFRDDRGCHNAALAANDTTSSRLEVWPHAERGS